MIIEANGTYNYHWASKGKLQNFHCRIRRTRAEVRRHQRVINFIKLKLSHVLMALKTGKDAAEMEQLNSFLRTVGRYHIGNRHYSRSNGNVLYQYNVLS